LRVILDNHRSEAGNGVEANGLWYTDAYPEKSWISDWQALAPAIRTAPTSLALICAMSRTMRPPAAHAGIVVGPMTGTWRRNAPGNAVLTINPKLLVFVEGTDAYNNNYYFWGGNLQGVAELSRSIERRQPVGLFPARLRSDGISPGMVQRQHYV